jgi:hypothetical protein
MASEDLAFVRKSKRYKTFYKFFHTKIAEAATN